MRKDDEELLVSDADRKLARPRKPPSKISAGRRALLVAFVAGLLTVLLVQALIVVRQSLFGAGRS